VLQHTEVMSGSLVAGCVVAVHLGALGFMLTGGLLAWRWPSLLWAHAPLLVAIATINLTHVECPLTSLELWLRRAADAPGYSGGFISHYLVEPHHPAGITPGVRVALYVIAGTPNAFAYAALAIRRHGAREGSVTSHRRRATVDRSLRGASDRCPTDGTATGQRGTLSYTQRPAADVEVLGQLVGFSSGSIVPVRGKPDASAPPVPPRGPSSG
jgi:hypothetical protein